MISAPSPRDGAAFGRRPARAVGPAAGRRPRRRGRPRRADRRDDAGPRRLEPVQHRARLGLRGLPAHVQPAHGVRQGPQAGPGLRRHVGALGGPGHVPHPRRDEVLRRHAGDLQGRLLLVGPRDGRDQGRGQHRRRLPRPEHQGRGRHEDRVPRSEHVHRLHDRPVGPDLPGLHADPARAHLRKARLQEDRRREVRPAARGHRPVHARGVEDRAVRPVRPEPELLGQARASPTRSSCASSPTPPTSWSRR